MKREVEVWQTTEVKEIQAFKDPQMDVRGEAFAFRNGRT